MWRSQPTGCVLPRPATTAPSASGKRRRASSYRGCMDIPAPPSASRSAPTATALPREGTTRRCGSGTPRPARISSRSAGTAIRSGASRSVPTASNWSRPASTRRRGSGMPRRHEEADRARLVYDHRTHGPRQQRGLQLRWPLPRFGELGLHRAPLGRPFRRGGPDDGGPQGGRLQGGVQPGWYAPRLGKLGS